MKCLIKEIVLEQDVVTTYCSYKETHFKVATPYGDKVVVVINTELSVGDYLNHTGINKIDRLTNRLSGIGIDIKLTYNFPWIYLEEVNGVNVKERFKAKHGFTAFTMGSKGLRYACRRTLFNKIREMGKEK